MPVVDMTGLNGMFQFEYSFEPLERRDHTSIPESPEASAIRRVRRAIQPMGLRLDLRRGPVEVVVIDSLARIPTED